MDNALGFHRRHFHPDTANGHAAGERLIIPTFDNGVVALTMHADGTLSMDPFLPFERVGSIVTVDALPDGRLAMGGFYTQLLVYDEEQDHLQALTNFPEPPNWYSISLRADGTLGVFEALFFGEGGRNPTWLANFTDDELEIVPVDARLEPSLSFDGRLMAITQETPVDPATMTGPFRHISIFQIEDMTVTELVYMDEGEGWCFGVHFHPTSYRAAYLCDYASLVIYDIERETRQEFDLADGRCVRWSPDGERVLALISSIDEAPFYVAVNLETGASQTLIIPENMPDYESMSLCPAWLDARACPAASGC